VSKPKVQLCHACREALQATKTLDAKLGDAEEKLKAAAHAKANLGA